MSDKKKLVFVMVPPEQGHINPIVGLVHKLVDNNMHVIFYSNDSKREQVERTGAEYRRYTHPTFEYIKHDDAFTDNLFVMYDVFKNQIDFSYPLVPDLLADVVRDQPDMIIYDPLFLPARYMLEVVKKNRSIRQPKTVMFITCFAPKRVIFEKMSVVKKNFQFFFLMFILFVKQMMLNWHLGIWISHPVIFYEHKNENLNIVSVFPELQPMRDLFDDTYKFVGPCILEQVRDNRPNDAKLQLIFDQFKPIDDKSKLADEERLVYVSMGTTFNNVIGIIETILVSLKIYSQNPDRKVPFNKLKVVFSLGDKIYEQILENIHNGEYKIPDNVFLYRRVPQIEILKRASLFITHAGQNSASETIQYSVPVISIPITADQPMVAIRMCDELKLGIRFDPLNLDPIKLADSIEQVLAKNHYAVNIAQLSKISRKYNGVEESTKLVLNYLNTGLVNKKDQ